MIDVKEHYYDDDPAIGPADVRTRLREAGYFFLGNGRIQAAVQFSPAGEGSALGLLIMDPERLGKKREALTMDPEAGLTGTMLEIEADGKRFRPAAAGLRVAWEDRDGIPAVRAVWKTGGLQAVESFFCPDPEAPMLIREISVRGLSRRRGVPRIRTGVPGSMIVAVPTLRADGTARAVLSYSLDEARTGIRMAVLDDPPDEAPARAYWKSLASISFGEARLDRFFRAAKHQLPALVSASGRVDGSLWQYNREWLRDQAVVAAALAMIGERRRARTMFARLLDRFVTPEGDTVDSSVRRDPDEVELDQNGFLLLGLKQYALWTGDLDLIRSRWAKIKAAAEFPLLPVFRHAPSGLLTNRREFWERHRAHGIEPGIELIHQAATAAGLEAGAVLARLTGRGEEAARWMAESARLRKAMLEDRVFRMVDNRGFIKRRGLDGKTQETIVPLPDAGLPAAVPLAAEPVHYLNPDTSAALPIVFGLVPPESPLAALTLASLETLWDQAWTGGGYGRYHFTSEPDSAGPWPFPSLFIARASVETGDFATVQRVLAWMDSVPGAAAGSWFEFYGRRLSPPFPQVGIIPWTWAELIHLFVHHMLGVRPEEDGLTVRPRLWPGLGPVRADLGFRGARLELEMAPQPEDRPTHIETDGTIIRRTGGEARLAYPESNLRIKSY
ncbi:MAG: hypothetical protein NTZ26_12430 [Candidatus Aminicenantes bacterium]|nr:hypothetical protein [Candidatus Aminicenantes bacterium]